MQSLMQEIDEYGTGPPSVQEPVRTQFTPSAVQSYRVPHTPAGQNFGASGFPI